MDRLIELPDGSWVSPETATGIYVNDAGHFGPMEAALGFADTTPSVTVFAGTREPRFECIDLEGAKALAARLAKAANETVDV